MELQGTHLSGNRYSRMLLKLRLPRLSEFILGVLFLLFWLAPTVRWRIYVGSISFAFMEPVIIIAIGILLINNLSPHKEPKLYLNSFILILILFFMWILSTRVWDQDWTHGLSDLRDWGIPILTMIVLLSFVKHGWRKWSLCIIPIAMLHSIIGLYQHVTNSFRPFASIQSIYKLDFLGEAKRSIAVGLFEHPNSFAVFLFISILITIGWLIEQKNFNRKIFPSFIILFFGLILYWTYAKAEILSLALILFLYFSIPYIRSPYLFFSLAAFSLVTLIIVGWLAINKWPILFNTIWWRIDLWKSVFQTISTQPLILLWGNGDVAFAKAAIWPQPHNIFFDILLNYGLIGLILLLSLFYLIGRYGYSLYWRGDFKRNPILRALWISILGFIVTGLVESSLLSIETRMIFLLLIAAFIGYKRELTREFTQSKTRSIRGEPF